MRSRRTTLAISREKNDEILPNSYTLLPRNRPNTPFTRPRRGPRSSSPTGPKTSSYSPTAPKETARSQPGRRCPEGRVGSTRTERGDRVGKPVKKRSRSERPRIIPADQKRSNSVTESTFCQPYSRNDNFAVPCEENLSPLRSLQRTFLLVRSPLRDESNRDTPLI